MHIFGSHRKLCGLLTPTEAEALWLLHTNRDKFNLAATGDASQQGWCRCRDIGGTRNSHHSLTLRRLAAKGLVEAMSLPSTRKLEKPLHVYRITEAGSALWAEYVEYLRHAKIAHPKSNRTLLDVRFEV